MLIVYLALFILLLIFAVFYVIQFYNILFRGFAPYINTNHKTISRIISELDIKGNETVYELGCASAGFLQGMSKKYPNTKLIGIEYSFLPIIIAQIQISLHGFKNISIIKKNIFNIDLRDANIIYCYLNVETMQKLKEKFQKECQPNTQIISYKFQINDWQPKKTIETNSDKVYFYQN